MSEDQVGDEAVSFTVPVDTVPVPPAYTRENERGSTPRQLQLAVGGSGRGGRLILGSTPPERG
jgi:hypothetical protein